MNQSAVLTELAVKLGVPDSKRFMNILDAMLTPEEAKICLELFDPATCPELAGRLNSEEKDLSARLDNLTDRGMLTRGQTQYAFHPTLLAFHHECVADTAPHEGPFAISQKVKDLWGDFFREEWSYMFMEHTEKMIQVTGRNLPISPSIEALERSPNIRPEDILPEENWKLKIENAKRRIIAPCGCRVVWGKCDHPLMTCFACFDRPRGDNYLNQPGRLLKEVTLAEALDIAREAEDSGLVHWGDCYCCDDCCENLFAITRDKRWELMTPNRYCAVVDEDKCKGCQICIDRCPFEAIEMRKSESSKRYKAYVVPEKCKGCGLCIIKCPQSVMRYEIVRPPEYLAPPPPPSSATAGPPRTIPVWGHYNLR
ncbi:MAG: 4Fe-4S binding protein [Dehalococcoidales bacterium]|nr:4Fe-4S binding protein [Dehalococcoidales bacterium]